jgi:hypothetical protein
MSKFEKIMYMPIFKNLDKLIIISATAIFISA